MSAAIELSEHAHAQSNMQTFLLLYELEKWGLTGTYSVIGYDNFGSTLLRLFL